MPGKVPERWEDYSAVGNPVKGTRFIAFKVPLEERICQRLPSRDMWFRPIDMIDTLKDKGHEIGLVIDLTNTNRYYNSKAIEDMNVEYHKIHAAGKVVPGKGVRKKFRNIVDNFLKDNCDNERLIGVHCTHGLNRSGYLVCRYMIEKLKFSPEEAIQEFNTARGHQMERENYLDDLRKTEMGVVESDVESSDTEPQVHRDRNERHQRDDKVYRGRQQGSRYGREHYHGAHRSPLDSTKGDSYWGRDNGYRDSYRPNERNHGGRWSDERSDFHHNPQHYGSNPPRMQQHPRATSDRSRWNSDRHNGYDSYNGYNDHSGYRNDFYPQMTYGHSQYPPSYRYSDARSRSDQAPDSRGTRSRHDYSPRF